MKIKVVMRRGRPPLRPLRARYWGRSEPPRSPFPAEHEKKMLNNTFEAGMCMKTKERKTQCPNRNRLIVPRFRHLRRIWRLFAENCGFCTTVCRVHAVSRGLPRALRSERSADPPFLGSASLISPIAQMGKIWARNISLGQGKEKPQGWRASLALRFLFKNDRKAARLESEPCATFLLQKAR